MSNKKQEKESAKVIVDGTDFVELQRDMQSAKLIAWLQYNQQQLIAGAIAAVLILVGVSLWKEQQNAQRESAALMYLKAKNTTDDIQRLALLDSIIENYEGTGYAVLANMQKSSADDIAIRKAALELLSINKGAPEISWQAKLDLAELHYQEGRVEEAKSLLKEHMGPFYEQARYAMLAKVSASPEDKIDFIQKALDAESSDNDLVARLEAELALLQVAK